MNSFFGIGVMELFFVAILALIVLGPERLPGAIREVMKYWRTIRDLSGELTSQFSEELQALDELNPQKLVKELTEEPSKSSTAKSTSTKSSSAKSSSTKTGTAKPTKTAVAKTGGSKSNTAKAAGAKSGAVKTGAGGESTAGETAAAAGAAAAATSSNANGTASADTGEAATGDEQAQDPSATEHRILPPELETASDAADDRPGQRDSTTQDDHPATADSTAVAVNGTQKQTEDSE